MPAPESHPVPLAPPPRRLIAEEPPAAPSPATPLAQLAGAIPTGASGPPAAREAGKSAEQRRRESDERTISHKVRGFGLCCSPALWFVLSPSSFFAVPRRVTDDESLQTGAHGAVIDGYCQTPRTIRRVSCCRVLAFQL